MPYKAKKRLQYIFILYWFLLTYIIAALIWWFIALNNQNQEVYDLKRQLVKTDIPSYARVIAKINDAEKRKDAQYIGEGAIFLLLIIAGIVFFFRAVRKQLKISHQQQSFMIAVTHELKTPIAVMQLNLETLQKRRLDDIRQQKLIATTLQEADRLNALCNNLLLSSQIESGRYHVIQEEFNFSELVITSIKEFITRFPEKKFEYEISEKIFFYGDHFLLRIVINNLIDNAIKYTPKETSVNIEVMEKERQIICFVKDLGKGIVDEEKKKVFDKFYRIGNHATKSSKGTGLGLYLSKKIILQHKGNIFIKDNEPTGAIFTIVLPQNLH